MLQPLGWFYGRIIGIRNYLYDRGVFRSHSLGARTISIGNITTGGTGKTPAVLLAVETLAALGFRPAVVSRGYRRQSRGVQVVPREHAERVAEIAWDIAKGDKEGRLKLYEKLKMPVDPTVKPERP